MVSVPLPGFYYLKDEVIREICEEYVKFQSRCQDSII